ncbi:BrxA family protein, partial [Clostridium sp.]|uniref:BrxA family protein n=1 Tax=Clostridium sp. TaxID=1506 RepID=UPI003D6D49BE
MVKELEYKTTIKLMSFLYLETKKASSLVLQGFNQNDIKEMSIKENIFQMKSETRKSGVASTILKRLKILDEFLLD